MKKLLLIILTVFISIFAYSQDEIPSEVYSNILPGDKIFASPDVMAFHKINLLPVNLYTGRVKVNIPIYEIKSGNIIIPISISYNTGGIKVDDETSNIGLGWNLNAGGSIIRVIKDLEDHKLAWQWMRTLRFDEYVLSGRYLTKKGLFKSYSEFKSEDTRFNSSSNEYTHEDSYPDLFFANAPGVSTKFYLSQKTNTEYIPNILNNNAVKIDNIIHSKQNIQNQNIIDNLGFNTKHVYYGNISASYYNAFNNIIKNYALNKFSDYSGFIIQNENGLKYSFGTSDIIESIPDYFSQSFDPYDEITMHISENYEINYANWHLDKIEDPLTNRKVNFTYTSVVNPQFVQTKMHVHSVKLDKKKITPFTPECNCDFWNTKQQFEIGDLDSQVLLRKNTLSHKISKIDWDGGTINFQYDLMREDYSTEKALTGIIIKNHQGDIIKQFKFYYSYFISKENCSDPECKRLRLDKIEQITDNEEPMIHSFNYNCNLPMPKVRSLEQDYLGYYNNNGAKYTAGKWNILKPTRPSMYFSPNKKEYSILPFKIDNNAQQIHSGHSLEANNYSLLGLLNQINYPTGGYVKFEYENHKFKILNKDIIAGGARIKKQILNNGLGDEQIYEYEYKNTDGTSSGYIVNMPKYGSIHSLHHKKDYVEIDPWTGDQTEVPETFNIDFLLFNRSRNEVELTDGGFVGYSRVIEKQPGNGYKEYLYSSSIDFPNEREEIVTPDLCAGLVMNNSLYPGIGYIDNDIKRGTIQKETFFDVNNQLLTQIEYSYNYKEISSKTFSSEYLRWRGGFIDPFISDSKKDNIILKIRAERNLLSSINRKEYYNGKTVNSITEYEYDQTYPLLRKKSIIDSNNRKKTYTYNYPCNLLSDNTLGNSAILLFRENRLITPLISQEYIDSNFLNQEYTIYSKDNNSNNLLKPKSVFSKIGTSISKERVTLHNYDKYGNPLYIKKNDFPTIYLWSYIGQYPIAEIRNATYAEVETAVKSVFSVTNIDTLSGLSIPNETKLKDGSLQRALPKAIVTTYTYKPLVGILTATDPREVTTYYEYDGFGRLKETYIEDIDSSGQKIKKMANSYDYYYLNQ